MQLVGKGNYLHILINFCEPPQDFPSPKGAEGFHFSILKEAFHPDPSESPLFSCDLLFENKSEKEEPMVPKQNKFLVLGLVLLYHCWRKCSSAWAELIHFSLISLFTNQTEILAAPTALFANELEKLLIQTVEPQEISKGSQME